MAAADNWGDGPYVSSPAVQDPYAESLKRVKAHAGRMYRAIDSDDLRSALKATTEMLHELNSQHSIKNYSSLYAEVFTHLQQLPFFFEDYIGTDKEDTFESLYAVTQHAGRVLPRLYLMIIAARCAIKADPAQLQPYLSDLLEFCKGIQNPIRGLFLRSFLNTSVRELLPDPPDSEQTESNLSITFLLRNFTEMNKLWTRMQRNLPQSEQRDSIRTHLAELVGKNLNQLAALSSLTFPVYERDVLPCITDQIKACKDKLAQQYLMEIVVMSFPDSYHLQTLPALLSTCSDLVAGVEIHLIMSRLMNRLAAHAAASEEPVAELQGRAPFDAFLNAASSCSSNATLMPTRGIIQMYSSLARFVAAVYDGSDDLYNETFESCHGVLQARGPITDPAAEQLLLDLLKEPLKPFSLERLINLHTFPLLQSALRAEKQRSLALELVESLASSGTKIATDSEMHAIASYVAPLINARASNARADRVEAQECMTAICRLVRYIDTSSGDLDAIASGMRIMRSALWRADAPEPMEALGWVFLDALEKSSSDLDGDARARHVHFFRTQFVTGLDDNRPAASLRLLLRAAALLCAASDCDAAADVVRDAIAVYHRGCARLPAALDGLAVIVQGVYHMPGLPGRLVSDLSDGLMRYATSLPTGESQVAMLVCIAQLFWHRADANGQGGLRDADAARRVLQAGLDATERAEKQFRGQDWANPATMVLDLLDGCRGLAAAGCDVNSVRTAADEALERLKTTGAKALGSEKPMQAWTDALQRRFDALEA